MVRARIAVFLALAVVACATPSPPAAAPAPVLSEAAARGLAYAQDACASCHAVAPGEMSRDVNAPSFTAIANLPGMTPTALNAWLHSEHPTMPQLIVAPEDRADLVAYLETLKRGGGRS